MYVPQAVLFLVNQLWMSKPQVAPRQRPMVSCFEQVCAAMYAQRVKANKTKSFFIFCMCFFVFGAQSKISVCEPSKAQAQNSKLIFLGQLNLLLCAVQLRLSMLLNAQRMEFGSHLLWPCICPSWQKSFHNHISKFVALVTGVVWTDVCSKWE